jgi:hypothetical protein
MKPQLVLGLLQKKSVAVDPSDRSGQSMPFEGGCALIADLRKREIRYAIRKSLNSDTRIARQREFAAAGMESLRPTYFGTGPLETSDEPFAAMHRGFQEIT